MTNEIIHGRADLHDTGPAQGVYEVDYTLHVSVRNTVGLGHSTRAVRTVSADVRPIGSCLLKNGFYNLMLEGEFLYRLEKAGHIWKVIASERDSVAVH